MFRIACGLRERGGWEVAPSEFWAMCPQEWWWLYDVNVGAAIREREDTMARCKRLLMEAQQ
jgi:hypothetical protein